MSFGITGYTKSMPFLRFHLGPKESQFLINLRTSKLAESDKRKLRSFLTDIGTRKVGGQTTAILGQMLLGDLIVVQAGKVMFLMEPKDKDINILRLADECRQATKALVEDFDGLNDLCESDNDLCDEGGVSVQEEDSGT
jgi:hypothetical protein